MKKSGRTVHELLPGHMNPRNSEGAFIDLTDGQIMFAYSHYISDSYGDGAPATIARVYSNDDGETWYGREIFLTPEEENADNLMSVSMLRLQNNDIGLFYIIKRGELDECRLHLRRSSDEGKTWSEAVCCINMQGYFVTNNDRVIKLSSGRLIVPTSKHNIREQAGQWGDIFDERGFVYFYYSDDDGYTWEEARNVISLHSQISKSGLHEPGVIELKNGCIWAWARTDMGRQYQMFSFDQGFRWTMAEPSFFTSPCSPLSMKRIPHTGDLLAVWNPIPSYQTRKAHRASWDRTPLIGAISKDEGASWENYFTIEDDEDAGYCYCAIHFIKDTVLFAYCAGGQEDGGCPLVKLRIKKVALSEVMID